LGARIIASTTRENPLKNSFPAAGSATAVNSSNEAPAQKGPVPPLRSTITRAAGSAPSAAIAAASWSSSSAGRELPLGWLNSTVPMPSATEVRTTPSARGEGVGL
jgi:hypothetical protein